MVDIHAHLLPGLDDGPTSTGEALRMCELYVAEGVSTVVATPHQLDHRFNVPPVAVREAVDELSEACGRRGLELEILPGGDVRLQPELLHALEAREVLTLADAGAYLLLELPPLIVPSINGLVFELALRGITPVLSHPERNLELWRKPHRLAELVEHGCLVQITAGSLLGAFGRPARQAAERFLKAGLVHVVATDAHAADGPRAPALKRAANRLASLAGGQTARSLLWENPKRIISTEGPEPEAATRPPADEDATRACDSTPSKTSG